ncbi:hypothetical protein D3W54_10730 [Komagataeibacter medellinensis]|uniref:Homogentisate 1,2-dioxygenase n=1 Tax=Komagataeibacter medellinensis TaxID=1177712 RepID=A0ABQ6VWL2_9PROT|nr:hypothetical protein [Komagataeibacter medellinensis]KAB8124563.1 hypothetical protein D3W54_10730 [Komagataeibacter medellinensis]
MSMRMKKGMLAGLLVLAMGSVASPVLAAQPGPQDADSACAGTGPVLPDELAGWATPESATAAANAAGLAAMVLVPGRAVSARLHPVSKMEYVLPPEQAGAPDSTGGMVVFQAPVAGTYRVMLGQKAWLDVVHGGETTASVHHQHGPACSGIGKMVDFELPAGRSVIELSAASTPEIEIMVTAVP